MIKSFDVASDENHLNKLIAEAEAYKQHLKKHSSKGKILKNVFFDRIPFTKGRSLCKYSVFFSPNVTKYRQP